MSFVTAGSAACPSTENSLRATSAIVLWTAEASQVEAMVDFIAMHSLGVGGGVRGGGEGEGECKDPVYPKWVCPKKERRRPGGTY